MSCDKGNQYETTKSQLQGVEVLESVLTDNAKYTQNRRKRQKDIDSFYTKDPISQLYRYAERRDLLLMLAGASAALLNGVAVPLTSFFFGELTSAFVSQQKYAKDPRYQMNFTLNSEFGILQQTALSDTNRSLPLDFISQNQFLYITHKYGMYYMYVAVMVFILSFIQTACWELASINQVYKLRQVYFGQTLRQTISWHDGREDEDLSNRITDDLERIRSGIGSKVPVLCQAVSLLFSGMAVGCVTNWKLSLVLLAGGPLLILTSTKSAKIGAAVAEREQIRYGIAGGIASEVLASLSTVTAFGCQQREIDRFTQAVSEGKQLAMKKYNTLSIGTALSMGLIYLLYGIGLWYGSTLYLDGQLLPGQLFTIFLSVISGAFSIGSSLPNVMEISAAVGSASVVFEVIDTIPNIDPYSKEGQILHKLEGEIEFKNVSFSYPSRPQIMVLNNLNVKIPAGRIVAFVGSSGAGKSTIISLILRFYDSLCGQILIDGVNISELNIQSLRMQVGVVAQEPILFDVSIEENIRYGKWDATLTEIEQAAKLANAHFFILNLPEGYKTMCGERGVQLSTGQKQRLALARALVSRPKVLLLDEATSALDRHSEAAVQTALEKAMIGRTTILIAHRLSTVRNAHLIFTMKKGRIVESGKHEELMKKKGVYYNLVATQGLKTDEPLVPEKIEVIAEKPKKSFLKGLNMKGLSLKRISLKNRSRSIEKCKNEVEEESVSYFQLMKLNPSIWMLVVTIIGCILSGCHMPAFSLLYGGILEIFQVQDEEKFQNKIVLNSVMFGVLAVMTAAAMGIATLASSSITEDMIKELRIQTFINLLSQQLCFFDEDKHSPSNITNTLAREPPFVKNIAGIRAGWIIITTVTLILSLSIAFYFGWRVALVAMIFMPIIVFCTWVQTRMRFKSYIKENQVTSKAAKMASECLKNIKTVQFLCLQEYLLSEFTKELSRNRREELKQCLIFSLCFAFVSSTFFLMYGSIYILGSQFVDQGLMTGTDVYRTIFSLVFPSATFGASALFFQDFGKAKVAIAKIYRLMTIRSTLDSFSTEGEKSVIKGEVELKNISFSYPSRKHVPILKEFQLKISQGQTVALVGGSGCGKSTVVGLLERFYDPDKGNIYIDGIDLSKMNVSHWRRRVGLVTQEPVLFDCSIRENISYGEVALGRQPTIEEIVQAATTANIHQFIQSLPQGYDTKVGERGSRLSGGQRQRVAIARALLRDPVILLLDEATSALDTHSEQLVQEALDKASKGRTTIVIAHRLSTIRNADSIAFIRDGKIVEQGTHDELMRLQGFYYNLATSQ